MQFWKWLLEAPKSENVWEQFSLKLLHRVFLILLAILLLIAIVTVFYRRTETERILISTGFFLSTLISFILFQRGTVRLGALALIYSSTSIIIAASFTSIGVYTPSYTGILMLLMFSAMNFERRFALTLLFLSIAAGLLMLPLHASGFLTTPENHNSTPLSMWLLNVALFTIVTMIMIITRETVIRILAKLQHEQELYRTILEDQTEYIVRWKAGGIRTFANGAYLRYFGMSHEEAIGTSFFPQINEDDHKWINEKLARINPENPIDTFEHRVVRPDGTEGWQEWSDRAFFDENGQVVEYQSVGRDITAVKDLEERQRELDVSKEREAFLRDFLSTMSHDLQTPLSVMRTNLHMLRRSPEKSEERIEKIDKQIDRLSGMINDILTVARLEHLPELERSPNNCATLIENSINPLRDEAKAKNIGLEVPEVLPSAIMNADATEFQRALSNLIGNAIKYTPAGGIVKIETHQEQDKLIIEVTDTGIGIEAQDLPHIFERFYRAQNAQRFEKGTGLGLAIVKRIIELHDGTISASSKPGEGSRFTIQLPLSRQTALA